MIKKIYNKKDWLSYAEAFDYVKTFPNFYNEMKKTWTVKNFQEFYCFKGITKDGDYIK